MRCVPDSMSLLASVVAPAALRAATITKLPSSPPSFDSAAAARSASSPSSPSTGSASVVVWMPCWYRRPRDNAEKREGPLAPPSSRSFPSSAAQTINTRLASWSSQALASTCSATASGLTQMSKSSSSQGGISSEGVAGSKATLCSTSSGKSVATNNSNTWLVRTAERQQPAPHKFVTIASFPDHSASVLQRVLVVLELDLDQLHPVATAGH